MAKPVRITNSRLLLSDVSCPAQAYIYTPLPTVYTSSEALRHTLQSWTEAFPRKASNIFTTHRGERPGIEGSIASQHFSMESYECIHPFTPPAILAPGAVIEIVIREANLSRLRISYKARSILS